MFKELLFDTVGTGDLDWSATLGSAAMELLHLVVRTELAAGRSLVAEANFRRIPLLPDAKVVQVFCTDAPDALAERYRARSGRHPGHLDDLRAPDPAEYAPLPLEGRVIRYTIGDDVLDEVLRCVR
jgi:hypothetical protein